MHVITGMTDGRLYGGGYSGTPPPWRDVADEFAVLHCPLGDVRYLESDPTSTSCWFDIGSDSLTESHRVSTLVCGQDASDLGID